MLRGILGTGGSAPVGGSGTTGTIPRWTGPSTLGDSGLIDDGTKISATGRTVTIGTTNERTSRFSVEQTGTGTKMATFSNAVDADFEIKSPSAGLITIGPGTGALSIQAGGAAAIRVLTTGNVGIGTASPGFKCVVADTVAGVVTSEIRNDSTNSAATARLRFTTQGGESWIEAFRNAGGALTFATLSTERARIDSAGNFILNTATTGATIQAAGTSQGLKLPATPGNADAQTLDAYNEAPLASTAGNGWTPTIGGTAAQWGGTLPTVSFARYVQIGSIVFCDVRLTSASIQSTYGVTTITPPPPAQNAFATEVVVPASTTAGGVTGNGAQFGGVVYLPTLAASTAIRLTWFYFTTS